MLASRRDRVIAVGVVAVVAWLGWRWWRGDELDVTYVGADPARARVALVLLHGHGAGGDDLVGLAREIVRASPGLAVAVPAGPHDAGAGLTWVPQFTAASREDYTVRLVREDDRTRAMIWKIIEELHDDGLGYGEIYVGGFSLGGRMAIEVGTHAPLDRALGGVLALSAGGMSELGDPVADERRAVRVLVAHGSSDPVIDRRYGLELARALAAAGHDVRFLGFDGGHTIPPEVRDAIPVFLAGEAVGDPLAP